MTIGIGFSIVPSTIAATQSAEPRARRPRLGAGQHLAPGRRRPRAGGADLDRDAAHEPPDRPQRRGRAGADRRLPPRLPGRRRLLRGRAAADAPSVAPGPAPRWAQAPLQRPARGRLAHRPSRSAIVARVRRASGSALPRSHGAPIGEYTTNDTLHATSRPPSLHPPKITGGPRPASASKLPGDIMIANFYDLTQPPMVGQSGPLILGGNLQPIWFKPVPTERRRLQPRGSDLRRASRC